jgi:hypothetical protein
VPATQLLVPATQLLVPATQLLVPAAQLLNDKPKVHGYETEAQKSVTTDGGHASFNLLSYFSRSILVGSEIFSPKPLIS